MKILGQMICLFVCVIFFGCSKPQVKKETEIGELTYEQLLQEQNGRKNVIYKASYFPIRVWGLSNLNHEMKQKLGENNKILMLSNEDNSQLVLLIMPHDEIEFIEPFIKDRVKFNFLYKPQGLFSKKMPLLKFVKKI